MDAWGPGLFQNDSAEDIKYEYRSRLQLGKSDEEALEYVLERNDYENLDDDEKYDFWLALASYMYDLGRLTDDVKNRALELIEDSSYDLERWSKGELKKREKIISDLKEKLNSPQPPRKKISVSRPFKCKWNVNDVFYYQLGSDFPNKAYAGKYILILVEKLEPHDARIEGLGDVLPVTILKLTDKLPENADEINNAPTLVQTHSLVDVCPEKADPKERWKYRTEARVMWYSMGFPAFEKKIKYLGNFEFEPLDLAEYTPYPESSGDAAGIGRWSESFEEIVLKSLDKSNLPSE